MRRGWLLAGLALLGLALAPPALAQTQPDADVDPVHVAEPLPPTETTEVPVNASVSCEGWGEAGAETVAVFSFPDITGYNVTLEPNETQVPAGPGECEPGRRLEVSTRLGLEPSRNAQAGSMFEHPVSLVLQERTDGETVREHGPYSASVHFRTGYLPAFDVHLVERSLAANGGQVAEAELVVESDANGAARFEVEPRADGGDVRVQAEPSLVQVDPGETERVTVAVEDRGLHPFSSTRHEIGLGATFTVRGVEHPAASATAGTSFDVTFGPWYENPANLVLALLTAAAFGGAAVAMPSRVAVARAEPEPSSVAATGLLVAGTVALLWGTVAGPPAMVAAVALLLVPGAYLWFGGRIPASARQRLAEIELDRLGRGGLVLGLAAFLVALALDLFVAWMVGGLALLVGAWVLLAPWLPSWARRALALAPVLFAIAPWLEAGVTVGAAGEALARFPVAEALVEMVGVWVPFLLALAALHVRGGRWTRRWAQIGFGVAVALAVVPDWVWGSLPGTTNLAGGVTVAGPTLVAAALAASLASLEGDGLGVGRDRGPAGGA